MSVVKNRGPVGRSPNPRAGKGGGGVLSPDSRAAMLRAWLRASCSPLEFLRWVWTLDSSEDREPVRRFPWRRRYLVELVKLWERHRLQLVLKSRQMMLTWLYVTLSVWECLFRPGRLIFFQSRREADAIGQGDAATGLLGRARYILEHIPGGSFLIQGVRGSHDRLIFSSTGSMLWAVPQGGHMIRGHTPSGILSDEAAFQPEMAATYSAIAPVLRSGKVRHVMVTTASMVDGGFVRGLWEGSYGGGRPGDWVEILGGNKHDIGLRVRELPSGYLGVELGMGADPGTFTDEVVGRLRASMEGWRFRQEQLRDWDAQAGSPAFGEMALEQQRGMVRVPLRRYGWDGTDFVERSGGELRVYSYPRAGRCAGLGVDVGAGVGRSESTVVVMWADSREVAATYASNRVEPSELGRIVAWLGRWYGDGLVCAAAKMHGLTCLRSLISTGYTRIWNRHHVSRMVATRARELGWTKGESSDPLLFGQLGDALSRGEIRVYDGELVRQLGEYIYDERGRIVMRSRAELPVELRHKHGDLVVALALSLQACYDLPRYGHVRREVPPLHSIAGLERREALLKVEADEW